LLKVEDVLSNLDLELIRLLTGRLNDLGGAHV
jgi:hypothetical protein